MKLRYFIFALFLVRYSVGAELQLGLDFENPELRKKTVVLVYLSNDAMNPYRTQILQNKSWLRAALLGKQYEENKLDIPTFSKEEIAYFEQLSQEDKDYLASLEKTILAESLSRASRAELDLTIANAQVKNPRFPIGLAIYRNFFQEGRLEAGRYLDFSYSYPGFVEAVKGAIPHTDLPKEAFPFPSSEQPITHVGVLEKLLESIYPLFPAEKYRYVLVIKSQGDGENVLAPLFETDVPNDLKFIPVISELVKRKAELLQGEKTVPNHRGTNVRLSRILRELTGKKETIGITAEQVLGLLAKSKSDFPLVFFDGNELSIPESVKSKERFPNVGSVFYAQGKTPHSMVDYSELYRYIGVSTNDFEVRFRELLREKLN